jgi:RNA 2',3'-cyclic 3'-phosphodiesterase
VPQRTELARKPGGKAGKLVHHGSKLKDSAMRLFTGIDIPYEIRRNLELLVAHLKPKADIQWSPLGNLHVTTKFIGEWPDEQLDQVMEALKRIAPVGALNIGVRGLGWFPNPHSPRVFWAGIEAPPELALLAASTERVLGEIGIPREDRPFSPHLTLARIRQPGPLAQLQKAIAELPGADFGAWRTNRFHLYRSQLRPGGSIYTKLASFPLVAE